MSTKEQRERVIETANNRFATRKYDKTKKISTEDWHTILEAGRLSPSSFGYEPWKFLLLNNEQMKEDIRPFAWGVENAINSADKILIILARADISYDSDYVKHLVVDVKHRKYDPSSVPSQHFKSFQEKDLKIENDRERFDWASKQTYIALANMMTAAMELGINSCPMEGFNYDKMNEYLAKKEIIDPKKWRVSVMASFGYRDEPIRAKVRQPLADIYEELN